MRARHRRADRHPRRRAAAALAVSLGAAVTAVGVLAHGELRAGSRAERPPSRPGTAVAPGVVTSPSSPTTTTSLLDIGALAQTSQLPSSDDTLFGLDTSLLWQAVVSGNVQIALPAFFPESAYVQVKGISDPVHDYETRLIPDFEADIATLHARLGPLAEEGELVGVHVPSASAQWVLPGTEYNKGSYWRVYGTEVDYRIAGSSGSFEIASMISWRGTWYVVHLLSIR